MITIDNSKCTLCKQCVSVCHDYCIKIEDNILMIDRALCDSCTQCIAICPQQALSWNNNRPVTINEALLPKPENLEELFKSRRSIRFFEERNVEYDILEIIVEIGKYAPTMNKNIEAIVINNRKKIDEIEALVDGYTKRFHKILFGIGLIHSVVKFVNPELEIMKSKMENRKRHLHNAPAMIILVGNRGIPMTELSAQFHLYNMALYSSSLGLGSIISDAAKIFLNLNRKHLKKLNVPKGNSVLGVLLLGYPKIKFVNKAVGYKMNIIR
jgi:NAD-dependent dihydropyrimidine dehydrogenase PreA subunit